MDEPIKENIEAIHNDVDGKSNVKVRDNLETANAFFRYLFWRHV